MDYRSESQMCSFCGRQGTRDTDFVGGFGVMMCVECLDHYHEAVHTPARRRQMKQPPWDRMSDTELLATLPHILRSADAVSAFAAQWVAMIRRRRISWAEIGKALGVSRQAAWVRFAHSVDQHEQTTPARFLGES